MSSDNLRANVTGVVDKDDSKRDVFLKLDALRNKVQKINVNLHKLFSIIAELREEISVIREERDKERKVSKFVVRNVYFQDRFTDRSKPIYHFHSCQTWASNFSEYTCSNLSKHSSGYTFQHLKQ